MQFPGVFLPFSGMSNTIIWKKKMKHNARSTTVMQIISDTWERERASVAEEISN